MTERRPLPVWRDAGVRMKSGAPLPVSDIPASLVDVGGRSFLVYPNYERILDYNCAHLYALSVGMLADRLQEVIGMVVGGWWSDVGADLQVGPARRTDVEADLQVRLPGRRR